MWRTRPNSVSVWKIPEVVKKLNRYYKIIREEKVARYLLTKSIPLDIDLYVDWGDKTTEEWVGPYKPGDVVNFSHKYDNEGYCVIKVQARDRFGNKGGWSELIVHIPRNKPFTSNFYLLNWIFDRFPLLEKLNYNLRFIFSLG